MLNKKFIKTVIIWTVIFFVIFYGLFYLTTVNSSASEQTFITKNIDEIKQDSFNSLKITDDSYILNIDQESFTISKDSLLWYLTKRTNELNAKQFLVILHSKNSYNQIIATLNELRKTEIKSYELVSE